MWVVVLCLHFRRMENGRGGTFYSAENENVYTVMYIGSVGTYFPILSQKSNMVNIEKRRQ